MSYTYKEFLEEMYIEKGMSIDMISNKLNISNSTIYKCLKNYNIPIRSKAEATMNAIEKNHCNSRKKKCITCGIETNNFAPYKRICKDCFSTQRKCTTCGKIKPISDFGHYRKHNTEEFYVRPHCKSCRSRKVYGIEPEEYDDMLEEQDGKCAICGNSDNKDSRFDTFHIDHDHTTGKVRGLLCSNCNRGIGLFNDNVDILYKAIEYLEQHGD